MSHPAPDSRRRSGRIACSALALAACYGICLCHADELRTHNGETLIGTIVEEQPDFVVFESSAFGRIKVPRERIASLQLAAPPAAPAAATAAEDAGKTKSEQAAEKAAEQRQEALSADAVGRFLARINPLKGWNTKLSLGYVARRGEDNDNDLTIRFQSLRKTDKGNEHRIEASYYYAEDVLSDGQRNKTDQLLQGAYQYRHPLSDHYFFQSTSSYYRDVIKQLDHEVTQTFGVGLRLQGDWWKFTLTPAAGAQWRDVGGDDTTHAVVGFYQEGGIDITDTLKFVEAYDFLMATNDSSDYKVRLSAGLNQKLGGAWSLGLLYQYYYDAVVGKDASKEQTRTSLTIGLEF